MENFEQVLTRIKATHKASQDSWDKTQDGTHRRYGFSKLGKIAWDDECDECLALIEAEFNKREAQTAQAIFERLDYISRHFDNFKVGQSRYCDERSMDETDYQALKAKYLKATP